MTHITEHYTKQKWECYASKDSWVDFLILRDTISTNNFLEWPCEFVDLEIGRWFNVMVIEVRELRCQEVAQDLLNFVFIFIRAPEESNIVLMSNFESIQSKVKSLLLCNKPFVYFK
jgi:hypothetical protein